MLTMADITEIARACHEANNAFCRVHRLPAGRHWEDLSIDLRWPIINGVQRVWDNPEITDEELHAAWVRDKIADGWVLGDENDPEKKTHPLLIDYADMEHHQKQKDHLFRTIVKELLYNIT